MIYRRAGKIRVIRGAPGPGRESRSPGRAYLGSTPPRLRQVMRMMTMKISAFTKLIMFRSTPMVVRSLVSST